MAVVSFVKNGFPTIRALMASLVKDMCTSVGGLEYFTVVYPTGAPVAPNPFPAFFDPVGGPYPDAKVVIMESRIASDPLANIEVSTTTTGAINAAWRIGFVLHNERILTAHAGTRLTLPGKEGNPVGTPGRLIFLTNRATNIVDLEFREPAGCMNVKPWSNYTTAAATTSIFGSIPGATLGRPLAAQLPGPDFSQPDEVFISRITSTGADSAYPMNYALTMSNRGIVVVIWEDNQEEIPEGGLAPEGYGLNANAVDLSKVYGNSPLRWFAIQRAVDRETGRVRGSPATRGTDGIGGDYLPYADPTTGFLNEKSRCPVFCVFGTGVPNSYRKFIVRENDSLVPSSKRPATYNTEDSPAILNPLPQQSVTEQGEFVVTFLNNLSTARFRYGDEMDMIGTVGAEVAGAGTSITVKVYNDVYTRTYTAMFTNRQYGKGMRIMMLTAADENDEVSNTGIDYITGAIDDIIY